MHRRTSLTAHAAILLLVATFAAGCDASRAAVANIPVPAPPAATRTGAGDLPAGWPDELALPPGAAVGATTSIVAGDEQLLRVSGSVALPLPLVQEHFEGAFADWTPVDDPWRDGIAEWRRGTRHARVVVGAEADGTGFTVRLS